VRHRVARPCLAVAALVSGGYLCPMGKLSSMLEVRDPADVRSVVAEVPAMTAAEVAAAYDRARTAFEGWRRASPLDRAAVLARAADLIRARAEDGTGWDVHHPFGGFRESGSAFKEQGAPGLRFYSRIKTAAVRFAW
jgi:acyl-CoA reductase-like NAD-dependent aldehyde dehydrogenase